MRKVKLVFVKSFLELPTIKDTFSRDIEVESPSDIEEFRLVGARVYEPDGNAGNPGGDVNAYFLEQHDESNLIGRLLTYVDATFTDSEQRKAHKDIVRGIVYDWGSTIRERARQTVDSQEHLTADDAGKSVR